MLDDRGGFDSALRFAQNNGDDLAVILIRPQVRPDKMDMILYGCWSKRSSAELPVSVPFYGS